MVARIEPCQRGRLRQALDSVLDPRSEHELAQHLEHCGACRSELERLAADESWWSGARELLPLGSAQRPTEAGSTDVVTRAEASAARARSATDQEPLTFLAPADDPALLGRLGHYDVCEILGRGGMGLVLKAFDPTLNRYVAIKVLTAELASSAAARRRFAREAQAAAAVVHEHVVPIHAVDTDGPVPYLVMACVPGRSLQERIDQSGPLELKEMLRIAFQAASGLAAAHAQGLVHRDIKPANILLENGVERVQLTDFGLARAVDDASLTQSGIIAGTPQYMSPEQARGEALDHRADLFSLGSVLYAMATGHPPFRAENTLAVLRRITEGRPRPIRESSPELPAWFEALVARLHAPQPTARYQSAAEVAELLERCLAHVQQPARSPLPSDLRREAARSFRRKLRVPVALAATVAVSLGGWQAYRIWAQPPTTAQTQTSPPPAKAVRTVVSWQAVPEAFVRGVLAEVAPTPNDEVQRAAREADELRLRWSLQARPASSDPLPQLEREIDQFARSLGVQAGGSPTPTPAIPPEAVLTVPPERN